MCICGVPVSVYFCVACVYAYFRKIAHIGQSTCPVCIWRFTPSTRPLLTLVPVCWPIRLDSYRRVAVTDIVYHAKNDTLENFRFRSHLLGALRKEREKKKKTFPNVNLALIGCFCKRWQALRCCLTWSTFTITLSTCQNGDQWYAACIVNCHIASSHCTLASHL